MRFQLLYIFLPVYLILCSMVDACGQNMPKCQCDLIITKSGTYANNDNAIKPGQTVCIQAGVYTGIYFNNFIGTKEKPIRFVNCGGQVIVSSDRTPTGIQFYGCHYFVISGAGSAEYEYGIRIEKTAPGAQALGVANKSSDCEIEHIEIAGAGFAGIMVKTDPTCDSTTWRGNLAVNNVKIHHNYIHDTNSEGMYVGSTAWNEGYTIKCNGVDRKVFPHNMYGLEIHHNLTERTGTEGIQYAASPDADVHHNIVRNSGLTPFASFQNNGMQIGGGVSGRFYNNQIINTPATGIIIVGNMGNTTIFNNLVVNSGANGIFCDDRIGSTVNTPMEFLNNTIINSGEEAIKLYNEINTNSIVNNIIAGVGKGKKYISFAQGATAKLNTNYMTPFVDSVGFVNSSANDFRLTNASKLIDKGSDQVLLNFDLAGNQRPIGVGMDIGAYEYHPINDQILTIYPIPSDDRVFIWSNQLIKQLAVYSSSGVEVLEIANTDTYKFNLSLESLPAGIYILRAQTSVGYVSQRFVKR